MADEDLDLDIAIAEAEQAQALALQSGISSPSVSAPAEVTPDPSFFGGLEQGLRNTASDSWEAVKSAGSFMASPFQTVQDAGAEKTLRTVGGLSAGTSGALAGAGLGALGGPLAPLTVPAGALVGGGLGLLGFNKANQAVGNDAPTDFGQDAQQLGYSIGSGALPAAVGSFGAGAIRAPSRLPRKISTMAGDAAEGLEQTAMGIKPRQIAKSLKQGTSFVDESGNVAPAAKATGFTDPLAKKFEVLRDDGFLAEASNDPKILKRQVAGKLEESGATIKGLADEADTLRGVAEKQLGAPVRVEPNWKPAEDYIRSGSGTAGHESVLRKQLNALQDSWDKANDGTFKGLWEFRKKVTDQKAFNQTADLAANAELRMRVRQGTQQAAEDTFDQIMSTVSPEKIGAWKAANARYGAYKAFEEPINAMVSKGPGKGPMREAFGKQFGPEGMLSGGALLGGGTTAGAATAGALFAKNYAGARMGAAPMSMARGLRNVEGATMAAAPASEFAGNALGQISPIAPPVMTQAQGNQPEPAPLAALPPQMFGGGPQPQALPPQPLERSTAAVLAQPDAFIERVSQASKGNPELVQDVLAILDEKNPIRQEEAFAELTKALPGLFQAGKFVSLWNNRIVDVDERDIYAEELRRAQRAGAIDAHFLARQTSQLNADGKLLEQPSPAPTLTGGQQLSQMLGTQRQYSY